MNGSQAVYGRLFPEKFDFFVFFKKLTDHFHRQLGHLGFGLIKQIRIISIILKLNIKNRQNILRLKLNFFCKGRGIKFIFKTMLVGKMANGSERQSQIGRIQTCR